MAVIVVRVGTEEKEISGLTRRTTCANVLEALFNDEQTFRSLNQSNEGLQSKNLRELVKDYVVMEDWRGCEKALSSQTRILAVWKAWGEEQCNVKFSLKKNKDMMSLCNQTTAENQHCNCGKRQDQQPQTGYVSTEFLSKLSSEQKKRIRRNMVQYQQAILNHQSKIATDKNNNADYYQVKYAPNKRNSKLLSNQTSTYDSGKITLSEEQFVDGMIGMMQYRMAGEYAQNTMEKRFYTEHCNYRRPHHRRRLPDDIDYPEFSLGNTVTNNRSKPQPTYRSKPKRRPNSERKDFHRTKNATYTSQPPSRRLTSQSSQNSSDSATSVNVPHTISELAPHLRLSGDEADDEKSIMTECGSLLSRQKLAGRSGQLHPCVDRLGNADLSTSAMTVADSSTTDTSNTSASSLGTTSSETSTSSADIYNESFFAKRAATAAAARAIAAEKTKSSGPLKLFKITNFIKKKKIPQAPSSKTSQPNLSTDNLSQKAPSGTTAIPQIDQTSSSEQTNLRQNADNISKVPFTSEKPSQSEEPRELSDKQSEKPINESEIRYYEQLQQQILSQEQQLHEECKNLHSTNKEIEELEAQIHNLRAQTHGINYVQDAYLSGCGNGRVKSQQTSKKLPRLSSMSEPVPWINDCNEPGVLEDYLQMCERVISTQMSIEENKRQAEILLQEVQDEIWRLSNDPQMSPQTKRVTALALGLDPPELEADLSDDDEMMPLSVSAGTHHTTSQIKRLSRRKSNSELDELEVKRTRMELEANLSLSLRLASEVDEVEKLMCKSRHLLQSKGETMLDLVRELAQSPEGIPVKLWDEFGDLLMAYDAEMALQQYLAVCASGDNPNNVQVAPNREIGEPPVKFNNEDVIDPVSPADNKLRHLLSPTTWTEQREQDLKQSQSVDRLSSNADKTRFVFPPRTTSSVSNPARNRSSSLTSPLLPMPPVPNFNDSDYEDITSKAKSERKSVTSTMISTEDAVPVVMLRHNTSCPADLVSLAKSPPERSRILSSRDSSSTIDDSGNASGGSTNSDCASTDGGSRNGSCDGGSRPSSVVIESQDSAYSSPLFLRDNFKQNDGQLRFTYPPQLKPSNDKEMFPKLRQPTKNSPKPPVPPKSPKVKLVSTNFTAESKRRSLILHNENRQKKLIRRSSENSERQTGRVPFFRRSSASNFDKSGISPFDLLNQRQNPAKPRMFSKDQRALTHKKEGVFDPNNAKTRCHGHFATINLPASDKLNPKQAFKANIEHNRENLQKVNNSSAKSNNKIPSSHGSTSTFENDSDTGLSSLHSSFDTLSIATGETLV